jgi:hypothetical protein
MGRVQTIRSFPEIKKTGKPVGMDLYPETKRDSVQGGVSRPTSAKSGQMWGTRRSSEITI